MAKFPGVVLVNWLRYDAPMRGFHGDIRLKLLDRGMMVIGVAVVVAIPVFVHADDGPRDPAEFRPERLPFAQAPIDYHAEPATDAVARLNSELAAGDIALPYDEKFGYLPAVLKRLSVSRESQLLVFSKTAVNQNLISPHQPRAVYFNDEISIAFVPGAAQLEIVSSDAVKGATFWVLNQQREDPPRFRRDSHCLACHAGESTLHVPGWVVRSFVTDRTGRPTAGYSRVTHFTRFQNRWGGWYVTGTHGELSHSGNLVGEVDIRRHRGDPSFGGNRVSLPERMEVSAYLTPHSDIVAQLVLNHQVHGRNLIVRAGFEARLNRRGDAEDQLLRYLLFADEAPLTSPVKGTSKFVEWFACQGPFDAQGRSLRDFDLTRQLFKYRLSYLVYTPAFDGLPDDVRARLYQRMHRGLTAGEPPPEFQHLPDSERTAIAAILRATKPEFARLFPE